MRSMKMRLSEFPIPKADLPDWVTHPDAHEFPIPMDRLRRWAPMIRGDKESEAGDPGLGPFDDLPF